MKVCAHINPGTGSMAAHHKRFDTIKDAVDYFQNVVDDPLITPTEDTVMDLYPQCDECSDLMNFHDYPMARYIVRSRGRVVRQFGRGRLPNKPEKDRMCRYCGCTDVSIARQTDTEIVLLCWACKRTWKRRK